MEGYIIGIIIGGISAVVVIIILTIIIINCIKKKRNTEINDSIAPILEQEEDHRDSNIENNKIKETKSDIIINVGENKNNDDIIKNEVKENHIVENVEKNDEIKKDNEEQDINEKKE